MLRKSAWLLPLLPPSLLPLSWADSGRRGSLMSLVLDTQNKMAGAQPGAHCPALKGALRQWQFIHRSLLLHPRSRTCTSCDSRQCQGAANHKKPVCYPTPPSTLMPSSPRFHSCNVCCCCLVQVYSCCLSACHSEAMLPATQARQAL